MHRTVIQLRTAASFFWLMMASGLVLGFVERIDWFSLAGTVVFFRAISQAFSMWARESRFWFVPVVIMTICAEVMVVFQAVNHASFYPAIFLGIGIPLGGLTVYLLGKYLRELLDLTRE